MSGPNDFSAVPAALGYAYQFRYALLVALRRQQTGIGWTLAIEAADDIEVSSDSGGQNLLQLKHRAPGTMLTDGSADLWKSLRVWSSAVRSGVVVPASTELLLITTSGVAPESVCGQLTKAPGDRDNNDLVGRLEVVSASSTNEALEKAHDAFRGLTPPQRLALISSVRVLPGSPDIEQLDDQIMSLSRLAVRSAYLESFVSRLEGWWTRRCLDQLLRGTTSTVQGQQFDAFFSDLREQFQQDNLPIDQDIADERPEVDSFRNRRFLHQLDLVGVGMTRLGIAVRDYHRAFVQRSRWSREGLLEYGELDGYERRLHEAWELVFVRACEDLGESATDDLKVSVARTIYSWAESADFPIRSACSEGFVSRGSFHMLADELRVGWHPDFELQLAAVIDGAAR